MGIEPGTQSIPPQKMPPAAPGMTIKPTVKLDVLGSSEKIAPTASGRNVANPLTANASAVTAATHAT